MIQGKLLSGQADLTEIHQIWEEVFIKEENLPIEVSNDENRDNMIYALVYEGAGSNCPVAAGRMSMQEESAEIELVAVLEGYRRKEYGDFIVRMLLDKAVTSGRKNITVAAPLSLADFFQRQGFETTEKNIERFGRNCNIMKFNNQIIKKCCNKVKKI